MRPFTHGASPHQPSNSSPVCTGRIPQFPTSRIDHTTRLVDVIHRSAYAGKDTVGGRDTQPAPAGDPVEIQHHTRRHAVSCLRVRVRAAQCCRVASAECRHPGNQGASGQRSTALRNRRMQEEVSGGGGRSRTADGGFADLCLTTWLRRPGAVTFGPRQQNGRRQRRPLPPAATTEEPGAGEGARTLDLLHGKQTL